jgi:MerR family transcriptional regulator, light-induced transcriptional regulator
MIDERLYQNYLSFLLEGNKDECGQIVGDLLQRDVSVRRLYSELFQPSLYEIGRLWETNRISVAAEHLATSITESLMGLVYPKLFTGDRLDRSAVIACSTNEYHQVGARMVADIFELNRWHGHFIGANTPMKDLLSVIDRIKPDMVGLSISIFFNMKTLIETVESIRAAFPQQDIIVGGQAFNWGGTERLQRYPNTAYIPSLEVLENVIAEHS